MRKLIPALALTMGVAVAFAQSEETDSQIRYVHGSGSWSNYCSNNDYFCIDRTKRMSHDRAVNDAEIQCRMYNGRIDDFSASCNDFCNPSYLPPNTGNNNSTYVSCNSSCQVRCEIPDHNEVAE